LFPSGFLASRGNSTAGGRVTAEDPLLLLADQRQQLIDDRDQGLAFHLVVAVAQVGGAAVQVVGGWAA
jgi:hypothetical protein